MLSTFRRLIATVPLVLVIAVGGKASADTIIVTTGVLDLDFGGSQLPADLPGPDGIVSFREALTAADNNPGPDTIEFAIPQPWLSQIWPDFTGRAVIDLSSTVLSLSLNGDDTTIDFSTQTGYTGDTNPDGNEVAFFASAVPSFALIVNGDRCVLHGLDTSSRPILLAGSDGAVTGFTGGADIEIGGQRNVIGGAGAGDGNVLTYVDISGADNVVAGNLIRGDFTVSGDNNVVGGPDPNEGNIIYGVPAYSGEGVPSGNVIRVLGSHDTLIQNNQLGLQEDGLTSAGEQFGGNGLASGIHVGSGSADTIIRNNRIAGIIGRGIFPFTGFRNSLAVWLDGDVVRTTLQGNVIGLNVAGEALGSVTGISVGSSGSGFVVPEDTVVGGTGPGEGNVIAGHDAIGLFMHINAARMTALGNAIYDNAGLGIDLMSEGGSLGVTPNDTLDADGGPNGSQNYPVVSTAWTGYGLLTLSGFLDSLPNESFRVEAFSSPACDDSGFGEGEVYLGGFDATTDGGGQAILEAAFPSLSTGPGAAVTTTATRLSTGETSEFSACTQAMAFASEPTGDTDGDTLTDLQEIAIGSDPNDPDTDADGALDGTDNCILAGNASQSDANDDGYGDACDADLNGDCSVDFADLALLKAVFFGTEPDADFNGDGQTNFEDLAIMKSGFFSPPGPSSDLAASCP